MKRLIPFLAIVLCLGCATARTAPPRAKSPIFPSLVERSVYGIMVELQPPHGRWHGTGWGYKNVWLKGDAWTLIVTNRHVVPEDLVPVMAGIIVTVPDHEGIDALVGRWVYSSKDNDVSVLAIRGHRGTLFVSQAQAPVASHVTVLARPRYGAAMNMIPGVVESYGLGIHPVLRKVAREMELTSNTYPGCSGSAVVNDQGEVVGMLWGGSLHLPVSYCVPWLELKDEIEKAEKVFMQN